MMDVLFYYYYLCYKNIIPDVKPHLTAVWSISVIIAFLVIVPIDLFCNYRFHIVLDVWIWVSVTGTILFIMYLHYIKSNKWKEIIKEKPMLWNSHKLSIIFAVSFFLLGLLVYNIGAILGREILHPD
jgi:archaellum biogenesis protein FlaJ (TadC family)